MHNELLVFVGFGYLVIYCFIYFVAHTHATADPWDAEITKALEDPDALPVCHRCFTPQEHHGWFCPECGAAVGRYNNWMPFVRVFSEGEILRAGTTQRVRRSFLITAGYLLYSLFSYHFIFAPLYWYFLFRNISKRQREAPVENEGMA